MSCCGEPNDGVQNTQPQNTYAQNTITNQQPGPHMVLEKPLFQQPTISSPPPTHGTPQPAWGQQTFSPPPVNQFGGYDPASSPPPPALSHTYSGSTYNGSSGFGAMHEPLMRPGSAHQPMYGAGIMGGQNRMSPPPKPMSPPLDEGKMSISIDFGMSCCSIAIYANLNILSGTTFSGVVSFYQK